MSSHANHFSLLCGAVFYTPSSLPAYYHNSLSPAGTGVFMYFAKVIPTIYTPSGHWKAGGRGNITTNQYSITNQYRPAIVDGMRQVRENNGERRKGKKRGD